MSNYISPVQEASGGGGGNATSITDGLIVDADVNASAAIASTKLDTNAFSLSGYIKNSTNSNIRMQNYIKKVTVGKTGCDFNFTLSGSGTQSITLTSFLTSNTNNNLYWLAGIVILCTEAPTFSSGTSTDMTSSLGDPLGAYNELDSAASNKTLNSINSSGGVATGINFANNANVGPYLLSPGFQLVNTGTAIFTNLTAGKWAVYMIYISIDY